MEGFSTFSLSYPQSKEEKPRSVPTYLGFPQLFTCGKLVDKFSGKLSLWKTANFNLLSTDNYFQKEMIPSKKTTISQLNCGKFVNMRVEKKFWTFSPVWAFVFCLPLLKVFHTLNRVWKKAGRLDGKALLALIVIQSGRL